jgi:hypothetical protein
MDPLSAFCELPNSFKPFKNLVEWSNGRVLDSLIGSSFSDQPGAGTTFHHSLFFLRDSVFNPSASSS